jgi:hypothetical protein
MTQFDEWLMKGVSMKLSPENVKQTLDCFESNALPENHPAIPQLSRAFGDHTFFIAETGLHVVEPLKSKDSGSRQGVVVKLARWTDSNRTSLAPQNPETTDVIIQLDAA